jgi:hypothetical protein
MSGSASFKNYVKKYAGIDPDEGTIVLRGNATFLGNGSFFETMTVANLQVTGNAVIPGITFDELSVVGNITTTGGKFIGNGSLLTGVTVTLPSTAPIDITGNVSGTFVNTTDINVNGNAIVMGQVNVSGNVVGGYFIGDGSLLAGVGVSGNANINISGNVFAPGNVDATNVSTTNLRVNGNAIVTGQVNVSGNVVGRYFVGNGALLEGVGVSGNAKIDVIGNVFAPGNVDATNVSTTNLLVNGNAIVTGEVISYGNVSGNLILGNGYYLTLDGFTVKPQGNVANAAVRLALTNIPVGTLITQDDDSSQYLLSEQPPNVTTSWFGFTGTNFPVTTVFGRTGAVIAMANDYTDAKITLSANVGTATANGYVSEALAYLNNFKATVDNGTISTRYFLGNVLSYGNVDATNVSTTTLVVGGNAVVTGQVNVSGNVIGGYFIGNGALLQGIGVSGNASVNIVGNVIAPGNVDATNVSTTNLRVSGNTSMLGQVNVTGQVHVTGQVNVSGNVVGGYFIGNGALLQGVGVSGNAKIDVIGNVIAPGNVDATNVSTTNLRVNGNAIVTGSLLSYGNVSGNLILGNGYYLTLDGFTVKPQGNVANAAVRLALTNIPVGTLITQDDDSSQYLLSGQPPSVNSNWFKFTGTNFPVTTVFGRTGAVVAMANDYTDAKITLSANVGSVAANSYVSNALAYLDANKANVVNGTISARYFLGNVLSYGNVDATNVSITTLVVGGNAIVTGQVNVSGNVIGRNFLGNVLSAGNVDAANVSTTNLLVSGNAIVTGYVNVSGNIAGGYFIGNVLSAGNVDATNVSTTNLLVNGNAVVTGQVNISGNVAGRYFLGNGALLTDVQSSLPGNANIDIRGNVFSVGNVNAELVISNNIITTSNVTATNFIGSGTYLTGLSSTAGACFILPSTGLTSNVAGAVTYSSTTGWSISLQQGTNTFITVSAYNVPVSPDVPFLGLPGSVTQTVTTPWAYTAATGIWSCVVNLYTISTFPTVTASIGNSTSFGTFNGSSNGMGISGVTLISVTGILSKGGSDSVTTILGQYIDPSTENIAMCMYIATGVTWLGQGFTANKIYHVVLNKNLSSIISLNILNTGSTLLPTLLGGSFAKYVSLTELYVSFAIGLANTNIIIYDKTCTPANTTSARPTVIVKVNPTAQTCAWWSSISPNSTTTFVNDQSTISINRNNTILSIQNSTNASATGISARYYNGGTVITPSYTFITSGALYSSYIVLLLDTTTGVPITNGVISGSLSATPAGYTSTRPVCRDDSWSLDNTYLAMAFNTAESVSYTFYTWISGASWTAKVSLSIARVSGTTTGAVLFIPVSNLASGAWTIERFYPTTTISPPNDISTLSGCLFASDGSFWTFINSSKNGVNGFTTVYTYGGLTLTSRPYSTDGINTVLITRGTLSNIGVLTNTVGNVSTTTDAVAGRTTIYGGLSLNADPYAPAGNGYVRFLTATNMGNLTFNNVGCTGLTGGTYKMATMDLSPNLTPSNFKTFTANTVLSNECVGAKVLTGPSSDSNYSLTYGTTYVYKGSQSGT